ncbi:MAG: cupin domain-containing protein, partial [Hyphomicrobiaceae bacterium]
LDALRWRWVSPGSRLRRVPFVGVGRLHLFKCAPSITLPEHGHRGSELTMVLRGTLSDSTGHYGPGDVCDIDESIEHTPLAGLEGCICVVAQDRPVRFRSLIVRLARHGTACSRPGRAALALSRRRHPRCRRHYCLRRRRGPYP